MLWFVSLSVRAGHGCEGRRNGTFPRSSAGVRLVVAQRFSGDYSPPPHDLRPEGMDIGVGAIACLPWDDNFEGEGPGMILPPAKQGHCDRVT